jgi:hypothetical protein
MVHIPVLPVGRVAARWDYRNPITITGDGSGIFPLDRSSIAGCQFFGFHGVNPPLLLLNSIITHFPHFLTFN